LKPPSFVLFCLPPPLLFSISLLFLSSLFPQQPPQQQQVNTQQPNTTTSTLKRKEISGQSEKTANLTNKEHTRKRETKNTRAKRETNTPHQDKTTHPKTSPGTGGKSEIAGAVRGEKWNRKFPELEKNTRTTKTCPKVHIVMNRT
jgi:hypothetical protein